MKARFSCLRFYVTHICNSKCWFCDTNDKFYKNFKSLSINDAKLLVKQAVELGCNYIDFTGGEPLIYKDLPELIKYANSLGVTTEITSNGINCINSNGELKSNFKEAFENAAFSNISLDTLNAENYKLTRGVDKLSNVLNTIYALPDYLTPKLMVAVSEDNIKEIPEILSFANERNLVAYLNPVFSYFDDNEENRAPNYIEKIKDFFFHPSSMVLLNFMEFYEDVYNGKRFRCSASRQTLTIAANGDIMLPCYHAQKREFLSWNRNLKEVLDNPIFKQYSNSTGNLEICQDCVVSPYFGTSCVYRLDKFFLLTAFSVTMSQVKYFLNSLEINYLQYEDNLKIILDELIQVLRTLKSNDDIENKELDDLYFALENNYGDFETNVYREPLSKKDYSNDLKAEYCWDLSFLPDKLFKEIFNKIKENSHNFNQNQKEVLQFLPEFVMRWYRFYITYHMKVELTDFLNEDENWIKEYISDIKNVLNFECAIDEIYNR